MLLQSLRKPSPRGPGTSIVRSVRDNAVPMKRSASNAPFNAAGRGHRAYGWVTTRLGLNTLLFSSGETLLSRSRDAVRNNPWAASAVDSYVANAIGKGIRMVPRHPDKAIRIAITEAWDRWVQESDVEYEPSNPCSGQSNFYGQQMIAAREIMEAGEVFVRFHVRPPSDKLSVPLQLQLLESEQLPLYRNSPGMTIPNGNVLRMGIEYREDLRRQAYHFYRAHPYETMFYPSSGLETMRIPATDVLHSYKPIRAGQMRGQPWMACVLATLFEIDGYQDAEIVRKKTQSMLTGFITKTTPEGNILPEDTSGSYNTPPSPGAAYDPMSAIAKLEPGTFQVLFPGEMVTLSEPKPDTSFEMFIRTAVHAFAAGAGVTYEQATGDLKGVNYSSIRAGLLEFRRKCEQFQHAVFIFQVCHPIFRRWLKEAVICGALRLPQYFKDPRQFENVRWITPGWPWVDPSKDLDAARDAVRSGFSTRTQEVAVRGMDASDVDAENASDNERSDDLGLVYDTDPRKVLLRGSKNPDDQAPPPPADAETIEDEETANAGE